MGLWSFESQEERTDENAEFGELLADWLETKGIDLTAARGVIMLVLEQDGFEVLQLGPQAVSDGQLALYVQHVAEHLAAAQARLN